MKADEFRQHVWQLREAKRQEEARAREEADREKADWLQHQLPAGVSRLLQDIYAKLRRDVASDPDLKQIYYTLLDGWRYPKELQQALLERLLADGYCCMPVKRVQSIATDACTTTRREVFQLVIAVPHDEETVEPRDECEQQSQWRCNLCGGLVSFDGTPPASPTLREQPE